MTGLFISSSDNEGECPVISQNAIDNQPTQASDSGTTDPRDDQMPESDIFNLARMISYRANARRRLRISSSIF